MKPDWDKLMGEYAGSATQLVADVDCTADGKSLCETVGVRGYPSIKWGDPSDLQDYQGGRDFDALKNFADENLKPICSPKNLDLCDDEKKAQITKYQDMSDEDLAAAISSEEKKLDDAEAEFKAEVEKLQERPAVFNINPNINPNTKKYTVVVMIFAPSCFLCSCLLLERAFKAVLRCDS